MNALAASASSSSKAEPPIDPSKDPYSLNKLEKTISRFSHTFPLMAEPRPNLSGGLLVLDLDYTIADTKKLFNYTTSAHEAERPGLHDFLAAVYPYYDICVWSQTSHWWLEAKLTEMGLLTDARCESWPCLFQPRRSLSLSVFVYCRPDLICPRSDSHVQRTELH